MFLAEHQSRYLWRVFNMKDRTEKRHWPPVLHMLAQLLFRPVTNFEENSFAKTDYTTEERLNKWRSDSRFLLFGFDFLRRNVTAFQNAVEHFGALGAA